jgi:5'-3' exoribonuclease 2
MLGLSTHEPYFYIVREQVITAEDKRCKFCGEQGHFFTECPKKLALENAVDFNPK